MELTSMNMNLTQQSTTPSNFVSSNSNFANPEPYFVLPPPPPPASAAHPPPPPAYSAHQPPLLDRLSSDMDQFETDLGQGTTTLNSEHPIDIEDQLAVIHTQEEEEDVRGCLLGVKRKTLQEMHDLYKTHGRELGFSVRKSTSRKNDNGVLYSQLFVCSCEGFRQNNGSRKKCPITRTGCGATMKAGLDDDEGCFVVSRHDTAHNHAFRVKVTGVCEKSDRIL